MSDNKSIVLIGFMGTGKTSVSLLLSGMLGLSHIDLDEEIEKREGRRISEIFADSGEAAFRTIETETLAAVLNGRGQVIATGGGAVLKEENRRLMLDRAWVVALKADERHIIERVQGDISRPLLQGDLHDRVKTLLEQRKHAYDFAHFTVDTSELGTEEVAKRIAVKWEKQ
ncbi:shikimate kinase [Paenibacillus tarimensis]